MARGSASDRRAVWGGTPRGLRAAAVWSLCVAALMPLAGCPPRGATGGDAPRGDGRAKAEERAQQADELARARDEARTLLAPIVAAHNERVARLDSLEVPAATVLRYPNGDRVQEDQLDGFIYLASRGRGAFELRLLGKTWAWLGGDGTKSWIYFSPPDQPSTLHVYDRLVDGARTDASNVVGTAELTLLTPGSLRFLLGLAPIAADWTVAPIEPAAGAAPAGAEPHFTERFEVRWSPTAATVASARFGRDGMPTALSVSDLAGNLIARTALSEFARVHRQDLAIGAWPMTATKVLIEAPRSRASARLILDKDALPRPARRARDEFFDLAELQVYLAPNDVVYHDPSGAIRGGDPNAKGAGKGS